MKREIAEIVIYAVLGVTVAPLVGYFLANMIVDATFEHMDIVATAVLFILSFIITYAIRGLIAFRMLVNFNSIHIGIMVYIIQLMLCFVLFVTMLIPFIYILAIAGGSLMGLIVTILKRPVTLVKDANRMVKHADEVRDKAVDHIKEMHDRFKRHR